MLTLYTDAELDALIDQVKAAVPALLAGGQRARVGDSEYEFTNISDLQAFGAKLAREKASRAGGGCRTFAVRTPRGGSRRGW